jgi:lipopolysaccharide/colanic/teichoic acid biosynthesis glycosyltransferase
MRRLIDVVVALVVGVVAAPVIALIALFRQTQCGLEGRVFTVMKFRTCGHRRALGEADDQRTPAIGRVLRASSLDELPQLWNILREDMSLIGPRPTLPEQVARYSDHDRGRLAVRPGLTGWAQVNGRNTISWPDRIEHDVWYIANRSLMLDLKIILRPAVRVLQARGVVGEGGVNSDFPGPIATRSPPNALADAAADQVRRPRDPHSDESDEVPRRWLDSDLREKNL